MSFECATVTANRGPSSDFSQNARGNPLAPGNSETYRSPARRKFAATSDDPDGDKRFPLLSIRSLRPAFLKSLETASFSTMPTSSQLKSNARFSIRQKEKRSIGDSNQRASSMLLRLLAIAAGDPPREIRVVVKHRGPKPLRRRLTGLCKERLALARCDCQSKKITAEPRRIA